MKFFTYLGGVVILMGIATTWNPSSNLERTIPETNTPSPIKEEPTIQVLSAEDIEKAFRFPTRTSTQAYEQEFNAMINRLSQESSVIDVAKCELAPRISKIILGNPLHFRNTSDRNVYISLILTKNEIIKVPINGSVVTSSSLDTYNETGGIFQYVCTTNFRPGDERLSQKGIVVVSLPPPPPPPAPALNEDGELTPTSSDFNI